MGRRQTQSQEPIHRRALDVPGAAPRKHRPRVGPSGKGSSPHVPPSLGSQHRPLCGHTCQGGWGVDNHRRPSAGTTQLSQRCPAVPWGTCGASCPPLSFLGSHFHSSFSQLFSRVFTAQALCCLLPPWQKTWQGGGLMSRGPGWGWNLLDGRHTAGGRACLDSLPL